VVRKRPRSVPFRTLTRGRPTGQGRHGVEVPWHDPCIDPDPPWEPAHEAQRTRVEDHDHHAVSVHVGQKLSEVRAAMSEGGFHHVPVVSGKKLLGMLSATDLLRVTYE